MPMNRAELCEFIVSLDQYFDVNRNPRFFVPKNGEGPLVSMLRNSPEWFKKKLFFAGL